MIAADHPDRAVVLQHPAAAGQPFTGEAVVGFERRELVPVVVDRVDLGVVGTQQLAAELEIVGGVGEHEVDRLLGQARQRLEAIALDDPIRL